MTKTQKMFLVLKKLNLTGSLFLGVGFGVLGVLGFMPLYVLAFLFIFNYYDLIGYSLLLENENSYDINNKNDLKTPAYRINQTMFQIMLIAVLFLLSGSIPVLIGIILVHWFGGQEFLYYIVKREKISSTLNWMQWTPIGIYKTFKKIPYITKKEFILQALIGLTLGLLICL